MTPNSSDSEDCRQEICETAKAESRIRWARGLLLVALLGVGCAGAPLGPPFRSLEPPPDHRARLVLYRTDKQGSLASVQITIDGRELGRFRDHEYDSILLSPGMHILRARLRGFGLLSWGWNDHRFRLAPGETTYLEISVRLDAREAPSSRELEIAGRTGGVASENVFIVPKSAQEALKNLVSTTRLTASASKDK